MPSDCTPESWDGDNGHDYMDGGSCVAKSRDDAWSHRKKKPIDLFAGRFLADKLDWCWFVVREKHCWLVE